MPTHDELQSFLRDWDNLTRKEQERFLAAVKKFVEDLGQGRRFRQGLRVKGVQGAGGIYEMSWAPDGRATFEYGDEITPGEAHIIWRRIGGHDIFGHP
jgi:hypothetical protein